MWQSAFLLAEDMKDRQTSSAYCTVSALAVADVDGDQKPELIVGT